MLAFVPTLLLAYEPYYGCFMDGQSLVLLLSPAPGMMLQVGLGFLPGLG
jgi:hypothetical protein